MAPVPERCPDCGGTNLTWDYIVSGPPHIPDGRHRTNELVVTVFLGCDDCSATAFRETIGQHLVRVWPSNRPVGSPFSLLAEDIENSRRLDQSGLAVKELFEAATEATAAWKGVLSELEGLSPDPLNVITAVEKALRASEAAVQIASRPKE